MDDREDFIVLRKLSRVMTRGRSAGNEDDMFLSIDPYTFERLIHRKAGKRSKRREVERASRSFG